jgi:pyruvate dehydrogenase E2 component (dihydrolipoamide acetyltransferase)
MAKEGENVKVGQTLVVIQLEGEPTGGLPPPQKVTEAPHIPVRQSARAQETTEAASPSRVLATPATRRLAREMNVDLAAVRGTGPQGRVTDEDVRAASLKPTTQTVQRRATPPPATTGGREEVVPLRGIRRTIAERMARSVHTAAHVTHVDEADLTGLVLLREAYRGSAEKKGLKLTFLPFLIKAMIPALKEFPYMNSSLDETAGSIILKKYYNIGIAVDTEQGLVVSVVKDADRKDVFELAADIEMLAEKARSGTLSLAEVHGSTITITNVGAIGGLFATPIINLPEVAILGLHKIAKRPVVKEGIIEVRDMAYLSLSFDHRVVDGAYAARFTTKIIQALQDPTKLLAEVP